jgi:type II secretory pathway pseudopilin PulG
MGGRRGFTLIELLIVMGCCGLLFFFSVPSLFRFRDSLYLNAAARLLASDIRKTRALAVGQGKKMTWPVSLSVFPGSIKAENPRSFTFSESGFPPPGGFGTQILSARCRSTKKVIVSSVGRVRIE